MNLRWEVLTGAALIAASILFIGRYQISAYGYGYMEGDKEQETETVYRLDRWTGNIVHCSLNQNNGYDALNQKEILAACENPAAGTMNPAFSNQKNSN